jgi:DNA-binding MarR family transcriptional regulator
MEKRAIEVQRKILEELAVDVLRDKAGHHGVFRVDVLINTLRVTLQATPEEIKSALHSLCQMQLVERGIRVGDKEVVSITDRGRQVLKKPQGG